MGRGIISILLIAIGVVIAILVFGSSKST